MTTATPSGGSSTSSVAGTGRTTASAQRPPRRRLSARCMPCSTMVGSSRWSSPTSGCPRSKGPSCWLAWPAHSPRQAGAPRGLRRLGGRADGPGDPARHGGRGHRLLRAEAVALTGRAVQPDGRRVHPRVGAPASVGSARGRGRRPRRKRADARDPQPARAQRHSSRRSPGRRERGAIAPPTGRRRLCRAPVVGFHDGRLLVDPSDVEIAQGLGFTTACGARSSTS